MRIIICGAGEVGSHAAEILEGKGHSITVIDQCSERLGRIEDRLDASVLRGNCAKADVLVEAGAESADLLVAATNHDEVNLLTDSKSSAPSPVYTTTVTLNRRHSTTN
jgi:trk system potassium uptake protein TrkA